MRSRAWRGLRGRLLLALVFTSAVTLLVAAAVILSPLQSRLRSESVSNLQGAVDALEPSFTDALTSTAKVHVEHGQTYDDADAERREKRYEALGKVAQDLRDRTGSARVLVLDSSFTPPSGDPPGFFYDTDAPFSQGDALPFAIGTFNDGFQETRFEDDNLLVSLPIYDEGDVVGVVVAERNVTDVTKAVKLVRNALITAAAIGLAVAIGLGLALSNTLTRRLGRLQRAALRITHDGPEAPSPIDHSNDEVGDLARALGRMQEELRRQEAARRSFVATASHELRTPLTMLQGTMELLDEDLRDGADLADAQEQVELARRELRRLAVLATELLDLSRLDAQVQLRTEPVELIEITRAVAAEFELHAGERGVGLELIHDDEGCWASADPAACARVVRILIDNALRYAPAGKPIEIVARQEGQRIVVEVADSGPGVPEDEREHIFERFHRGKATSAESGFGLGLAIGRELAERMNGRLTLEDSEAGACFRLTLPAQSKVGPTSAGPRPAVSRPQPAGSGTP